MRTNKKTLIADDLRTRIRDGLVGEDERLPTEADLAEEYDTTRTTVRAAYQILIDAMLVEKRGLSGYFVRAVKTRTWTLADSGGYADPWQVLLDTGGAARGRQVTTVRTEHGAAPIRATTLAVLLDVAPDTLIACRASVRYYDGEPVELTEIFIPYERVKDTPFMSSADTDIYALLDGSLLSSTDRLAWRNPTPGEKARLELPEATPVVEIVRRLFREGDGDMVIRSVFSAVGAEFVTRTQA